MTELVPILLAVVVMAAAIAIKALDSATGFGLAPQWPAVLGIGSLAGMIAYVLFREARRSQRSRGAGRTMEVSLVSLAIAGTFALLLGILFMLESFGNYGTAFIAIWGATSIALVVPILLLLDLYRRMLVAEGRMQHRVALFGHGEALETVKRSVQDGDSGIVLAGIFEDARPVRYNDTAPGLDELVECARSGGCDRVILALPLNEPLPIKQVLDRLSAMPIIVQLYSAAPRLPYRVNGAEANGSVLLLNLQDRPLGPRGLILKTALDYSIATLALIGLSPLLALIVVAIKLDSRGPAFFVQPRGGYRQRTINVFKFRTMNVLETGPEVTQARRNDPRVTRVGRVLRRTSLDELPQLFNVLRGELSLVGPRPHAVAHDQQYGAIVEQYANRHKIKPGITGWAQVNGFRSLTDDPELMRERVKYDLYYIDHWSPWLDIKILVRTVGVLFGDQRAY